MEHHWRICKNAANSTTIILDTNWPVCVPPHRQEHLQYTKFIYYDSAWTVFALTLTDGQEDGDKQRLDLPSQG